MHVWDTQDRRWVAFPKPLAHAAVGVPRRLRLAAGGIGVGAACDRPEPQAAGNVVNGALPRVAPHLRLPVPRTRRRAGPGPLWRRRSTSRTGCAPVETGTGVASAIPDTAGRDHPRPCREAAGILRLPARLRVDELHGARRGRHPGHAGAEGTGVFARITVRQQASKTPSPRRGSRRVLGDRRAIGRSIARSRWPSRALRLRPRPRTSNWRHLRRAVDGPCGGIRCPGTPPAAPEPAGRPGAACCAVIRRGVPRGSDPFGAPSRSPPTRRVLMSALTVPRGAHRPGVDSVMSALTDLSAAGPRRRFSGRRSVGTHAADDGGVGLAGVFTTGSTELVAGRRTSLLRGARWSLHCPVPAGCVVADETSLADRLISDRAGAVTRIRALVARLWRWSPVPPSELAVPGWYNVVLSPEDARPRLRPGAVDGRRPGPRHRPPRRAGDRRPGRAVERVDHAPLDTLPVVPGSRSAWVAPSTALRTDEEVEAALSTAIVDNDGVLPLPSDQRSPSSTFPTSRRPPRRWPMRSGASTPLFRAGPGWPRRGTAGPDRCDGR